MSPVATVQAGEIIWPDPRNMILPPTELFYLRFVSAQATHTHTHTHTHTAYIYIYTYI